MDEFTIKCPQWDSAAQFGAEEALKSATGNV